MQLYTYNSCLQVLPLKSQQNLYQVFLGVLRGSSLVTSDIFVSLLCLPCPRCYHVRQTPLNLLDLPKLSYSCAAFLSSSRHHCLSWRPPLVWSCYPASRHSCLPQQITGFQWWLKGNLHPWLPLGSGGDCLLLVRDSLRKTSGQCNLIHHYKKY